MNSDDKIRAILRMEADAVEPSPAGWDAIQQGVAASRGRGWWTRGVAVTGVAAVLAGTAFYVAADRAPRGIRETPTNPGPGVTTQPSGVATPTVRPVDTDEPIDAIWPLTTTGEVTAWQRDRSTYPALGSARTSALAFARNYVGIPGATVTPLQGDFGENLFQVHNGDLTVSRVTVRGFGKDGTAPFVVTYAEANALRILTPSAGAAVDGKVVARGVVEGVEAVVDVSLRADGPGSAPVELVEQRASLVAAEGTWAADLAFRTSSRTGSVLVTVPTQRDGSVGAAAAVPVTFGTVTTTGPTVMVASREGRIAVVSTRDGRVVRWLTEPVPGAGASDPELSDDGKTVVYAQATGTCASEIRGVPVTGGPHTVLVPQSAAGAAFRPSRRGEVLAYLRTKCAAGGTDEEVVVQVGTRTITERLEGRVHGHLAVGSGVVAFVSRTGDTTTLHTLDVYGDATSRATAQPVACTWITAAWGPAPEAGGERLFGAAMCPNELVLYRFDSALRTREPYASVRVESVTSLDFAGESFVVGHAYGGADRASTYVDGTLHLVPGVAQRPTWS